MVTWYEKRVKAPASQGAVLCFSFVVVVVVVVADVSSETLFAAILTAVAIAIVFFDFLCRIF